MGWWMALNLRKALPKSTTLYIYDIVASVLDNFVALAQSLNLGVVEICRDARTVADKAVLKCHFLIISISDVSRIPYPVGRDVHDRPGRQACSGCFPQSFKRSPRRLGRGQDIRRLLNDRHCDLDCRLEGGCTGLVVGALLRCASVRRYDRCRSGDNYLHGRCKRGRHKFPDAS